MVRYIKGIKLLTSEKILNPVELQLSYTNRMKDMCLNNKDS